MVEGYKINAHNLLEIYEIQNEMQTDFVKNVKTPLLMFLGKSDEVICNKTARKAFEQFPVEDKTLIELDEPADHYCLQEKDYYGQIMDTLDDWCGKRLN